MDSFERERKVQRQTEKERFSTIIECMRNDRCYIPYCEDGEVLFSNKRGVPVSIGVSSDRANVPWIDVVSDEFFRKINIEPTPARMKLALKVCREGLIMRTLGRD